ncbi:MAG: hypothetical protein ACREQR_00220 [Candidatus Binataceae bacterium]
MALLPGTAHSRLMVAACWPSGTRPARLQPMVPLPGTARSRPMAAAYWLSGTRPARSQPMVPLPEEVLPRRMVQPPEQGLRRPMAPVPGRWLRPELLTQALILVAPEPPKAGRHYRQRLAKRARREHRRPP